MEEYYGKICPFCKTEIKGGDDVIVCPDCGTPHHESCWKENKGCTTVNCTQHHCEEKHNDFGGFCEKCGTPLGKGQDFCTKCGASRHGVKKSICIKCGTELQDGQDFCPKCGTPRCREKKQLCIKCGNELQDGQAFCPKCGQRVEFRLYPGARPDPSRFNQVVIKSDESTKKKSIKMVMIAVAALLIVALATVAVVPIIFKSQGAGIEISEHDRNRDNYSLEGDWQFSSMIFDDSRITPDLLEANDWDFPALNCTESEFMIVAFDSFFSGTWEDLGDKRYRFFDDDFEQFTAALEIEDDNKQTLTLRNTYQVQQLTGHTLTMVFERN